MGAPSSEQEAREIAAEIEQRPNLAAVNDRFQDVLAAFPPVLDEKEKDRKFRLELLSMTVGTGLLRGQDITAAERDEWLALLAESR